MHQRLIYDRVSQNKESIIKDYTQDLLSERAIARKHNVSRKVIREIFKTNSIVIRSRFIYPSDIILYRKYITDKKSIGQISNELNICYGTVNKLLIKYNYKKKFNKKPSLITQEIIFDYNNGLSSIKIAKKYEVSKPGVLKILRKNNIKTRPTRKTFSKELLEHKYLNEKKSIREIVKETKSHEATVRRNLKDVGIIPRRFNEQQLIDNDNGKKINLNRIKEGIEKDPRFFYLLGAFKGDGHYNIKQNKIQFSVTDLDFIEEIKRLFNMLSPETHMNILDHVKATKRTKKQWRINICCRGFFNRGYHKLLPQTLQEKRFYLKGLFDAEGSVSEDGLSITITQKNIDDLRLWKGWLEELGIITSMHINNGKTIFHKFTSNKMYRYINNCGCLRVLSNDSKINFNDAIGFKIKRKQDRLEKGIKKIKPLPIYNISDELIAQDLNKMKVIKVKSIKFSHREQGVDLSVLNYEHHNFILNNGVTCLNSTMAQQIAYFLAWMLAGGRMESRIDPDGIKRWFVARAPTKPVRFSLEDNMVFSPEDLMKAAYTLRDKYGRNQVIVYDEGRAGLDSARAMQAINKAMQDFFQECGQHGHIILIVLPDFFKLHEDYATVRSLFLVDVFADRQLRRGWFNFYNDAQKEKLYVYGKKVLGLYNRYSQASPSFYGRFTAFMPIDEKAYDLAKQKALRKKQFLRNEKKFKTQRDAAIYLIKRETDMSCEEIATEMTATIGSEVSEEHVRNAIKAITHEKDEEEIL
jgi:hypothetical protein